MNPNMMPGNNNGKIFPGMCPGLNPEPLEFKDPKIIPGLQQPTGPGMMPGMQPMGPMPGMPGQLNNLNKGPDMNAPGMGGK